MRGNCYQSSRPVSCPDGIRSNVCISLARSHPRTGSVHSTRGVVNKVILLATAMLGLLALPSTAGAARTAVTWECPEGFQVREALNVGLPHKGLKRSFWVYPPADSASPAPVWVPLTGTVESTNNNLTVPRSGANALMAREGFMVIGPVRQCAEG